MSEARQTEQVPGAVDQTARSTQALVIEEGDDIIEKMRKQLEAKDAELIEQRRQAEERSRQLEDERRAREHAEQRAREAHERETVASRTAEDGRRTVEDAQLDAISTGLQARESQMKGLEAQLAAAGAEGDFAKLASVQVQIGKLSAEIVTLEAGKTQLEQLKATRASQAGTAAAQPDREAQEEAYISSQTPAVQQWLRDHRAQFFGDKGFQARVMAAGKKIYESGVSAYNPKYIEMVETELGMRQAAVSPPPPPVPNVDVTLPPPVQPGGRQADRMTAAPASGAVSGAGTGDTELTASQVRLTPGEVEMARLDNQEEWNKPGGREKVLARIAQSKRELIAEGRLFSHGRQYR